VAEPSRDHLSLSDPDAEGTEKAEATKTYTALASFSGKKTAREEAAKPEETGTG
jgi:hypothetical protein